MKTIKVLTIAATLVVAPAMSFAMGCDRGHKQAMSCADGSAWDAATRTCKPLASS